MKGRYFKIGITVVVCILCLIGCGYFLCKALDGWGGLLGIYGNVLFAFACFATFCIIIAFPLARRFSVLFGNLYMPNTEYVPPPHYYLIDLYIQRGEFDRALTECNNIIKRYPEDLEAHKKRVEVLGLYLHRAEEAKEAYEKGLSVFENEAARNQLRLVGKKVGIVV